jgi:hypothetical protein
MSETQSGRPTPHMIRLFHRFSGLLGRQPDDGFICEPELPEQPLVHVALWRPDRDSDVTSLQTFGMSAKPMPNSTTRAELHLGCREPLDEAQCEQLAYLLAHLAAYPFLHRVPLDWWEIIPNAGHLPGFPGCRHLLLHPRLAEESTDEIDDEEGTIKLLYVVPITEYERRLLVEQGREAFLDHLVLNRIDLLKDRSDS